VHYSLVASLEEANARIEKAKKEAMAKEAEVNKLMITVYELRQAQQHQKVSSPRPNFTTLDEVRQMKREPVQMVHDLWRQVHPKNAKIEQLKGNKKVKTKKMTSLLRTIPPCIPRSSPSWSSPASRGLGSGWSTRCQHRAYFPVELSVGWWLKEGT